jgi:hypothetical protein
MHPAARHPLRVYQPSGHVMISFPRAAQAHAAAQALQALGWAEREVHAYTDFDMLAQIDNDLHDADNRACIDAERGCIDTARDLAELGHHWLLVQTGDVAAASRVAECVQPLGADHALHYGPAVVHDLIQPLAAPLR